MAPSSSMSHSRGQLYILSIHVTAYCNRESSKYADVLFLDVSSENMRKASRPIRKSKDQIERNECERNYNFEEYERISDIRNDRELLKTNLNQKQLH